MDFVSRQIAQKVLTQLRELAIAIEDHFAGNVPPRLQAILVDCSDTISKAQEYGLE